MDSTGINSTVPTRWLYVAFGVTALLVLLGSAQALAQQNTDAAEDTASGGKLTKDQIIAAISSEVILAPGVGLRHIRLGEPLEFVKNRLGEPQTVTQKGFFSRDLSLVYELDKDVLVALEGRNAVESIYVTGRSSALVRTAQGARFGMQPELIRSIYRSPSKIRKDRMEYRHLGVTFYFANNGVAQIELYPAEK